MMGRQNNDQGPLFYEFRLDEAVPDDHLVRKIDAVLDLSWVHAELAPHYPTLGRPSVDPVLMIRMLIIGYVFALRSERLVPISFSGRPHKRWKISARSKLESPSQNHLNKVRTRSDESGSIARRSVWTYCFAHFIQTYQPSPKGWSGRPAHCLFRGLLSVHSRCGLHTRAVTNSWHANRRLQPLRYLLSLI